MSILKKWAGCVMSFIAGVLGLALSATTGMKVVTEVVGNKIPDASKTVKAFKVITDSNLYDEAKLAGNGTEFVWLKIFAILTLIISILLIVYSIISLLQNVNVIKSTHIAFDIVGWALVGLFLIATIGLLISSNVYANVTETSTIASVMNLLGVPKSVISCKASVGVYQPVMLVVSIITAIVTGVFSFLKKKDA